MKAKALVEISVLCALLIICSLITIPIPFAMPITMQTFAISLIGYIAKSKKGIATVALYILIGCVGMPVFSAFGAGIGRLFDISGGFIWGFLPMVAITGIETKNRFMAVLFGILGLLVCHLSGIIQYSFITNVPFLRSFVTVSAVYLIKDIMLTIFANIISIKLLKRRDLKL